MKPLFYGRCCYGQSVRPSLSSEGIIFLDFIDGWYTRGLAYYEKIVVSSYES